MTKPTIATLGPKYPAITVQLTGLNGDELKAIRLTRNALRHCGVTAKEIAEFTREALDGDDYHALHTVRAWVATS